MQFTKVAQLVQKTQEIIFIRHPAIKFIVEALHQQGARILLVGGAVRDVLLQKQLEDIDCEVHGVASAVLEKTLKQFGYVRLVGKAYGVFKIDGIPADWSLPRTDTAGRKPTVTVDPYLPLIEAFKRRDVTINAMGIDLVTQELIDPFGGVQDLYDKKLRTPDAHFFVQDPLRFYRVMQFIGRFGMTPDTELNNVCSIMDVEGVAQERISNEFEKLFLKSDQPSLGIRWLATIGRLEELLPEVAALQNVNECPEYHPEKDVFEHSMQAIDAAASYTYPTAEKKLIMVMAALAHDLGKPSTTRFEDGRIRSNGHDVAGVKPAGALLARITQTKSIVDAVLKLVRYHMTPIALVKNDSSPAAYKRLALKLSPGCTLYDLYMLAKADKSARNSEQQKPLSVCSEPLIEEFLIRAQQYGVAYGPEEPVLMGADFLDVCTPGPQIGMLVQKAYELQIEQSIKDKKKLKEMVLKNNKYE